MYAEGRVLAVKIWTGGTKNGVRYKIFRGNNDNIAVGFQHFDCWERDGGAENMSSSPTRQSK